MKPFHIKLRSPEGPCRGFWHNKVLLTGSPTTSLQLAILTGFDANSLIRSSHLSRQTRHFMIPLSSMKAGEVTFLPLGEEEALFFWANPATVGLDRAGQSLTRVERGRCCPIHFIYQFKVLWIFPCALWGTDPRGSSLSGPLTLSDVTAPGRSHHRDLGWYLSDGPKPG